MSLIIVSKAIEEERVNQAKSMNALQIKCLTDTDEHFYFSVFFLSSESFALI